MSTKPTANYGTISTPSLDTFITRAAVEPRRTLISHRRPWREFLSLSSLSPPSSYSQAMSRIRRNSNYFRFNYSLIVLIIVFLSLLWHPTSMLAFLALFVLWFFLFLSRDQPLVVFSRSIDDRVVVVVLGVVTVLGLVFTGVGVNVLVSLVVGFAFVGLHAAFRSVDDLFLDEDDVGGDDGGLVLGSEGQPLRPTYGRVV